MALLNTKQPMLFERIISQNGRLFLMRFIVVEREGKLRGKIISCEPILGLSDADGSKGKYYFPAVLSAQRAPEGRTLFKKIVSPFSRFEFLTSIQIRAPAH
jgi:hypothetical protein